MGFKHDIKVLKKEVKRTVKKVKTKCRILSKQYAERPISEPENIEQENIRQGIIGQEPNGKSVEVDEDSGVYNDDDHRTWYRVTWPVDGWIVGKSVGLPEQ
jgi:hypothetical protein